jgi:chromosome segregation protein
MRVEKIELNGFKSFGDRTVINLHPGITCIVGPNGCGKSNVVDAFKWVLGEQSAKSLRGGKMEEVIFAGSQSKKPKGMSEVTLTVSGLGGTGDNGETVTTVTRRLYRSGDSDYMLNRNVCRLRDIRDIFLDTGLELKSYSILEQDRISAILSAKPEERRFLIEEVAGVVKYKVRRHEAQNKLESSRNNLQRINDVIAEVRRQINSLDRQVRKAERYKRLMEQLREIELRVAKRDFVTLQEELNTTTRAYEGTKEEDSLLRAEQGRLEVGMETRRLELVEKEKALEAVQARLQELKSEMAEMERLIAVGKTEREHLRETVSRLGGQIGENEERRISALRRKEDLATLEEELEGAIASLASDMETRAEALRAAKEELGEKETHLEVKRRESFRFSEELGHLRNEHHRMETALEHLSRSGESVRTESEELQSHRTETEAAGRTLESSIHTWNSELLVLRAERGQLEDEIEKNVQRLETMRADTARAREDLASSVSRLESLKEILFADSSEEALRDETDILGALADIVKVPTEYERPIESALREAVNGYVLPGYEDVKRGVGALRAKDMGRTAFIPVADGGPHPENPLPEGALARASELVRQEERFAPVVERLLGNVAVVKDLETALALRVSGFTLVTMEGDVVEPSGTVVSGKSRGILALRRQSRELTEEIEARRSKVHVLEKEAEGVQSLLEEKNQALARLNEKSVEMEKELSLLRHKAEKNTEELERLNRKLAHLRIELGEIQREQVELRELMERKAEEVRLHEEKKTLGEQDLERLQEQIQTMKTEYESRSAENVELRLSLNSRRDRLSALRSEGESIESLVRELAEKDELIRREIQSTEERIAVGEADSAAREEALGGLARRAGEHAKDISDRRDVISTQSEGLRETEHELKSLRARIDDTSHRLSELDVQKAEHSLRIENLVGNIRNLYGVELLPLETEEVQEGDEEKVPELKRKIESLGPVSLGSIEEHEELRERFEFLTGQREDLTRSIAELEEAISRINTTTRKKLRDAYEGLKTRFTEVFLSLFGGGRAELVLTDERNILETGIDIIAQPPGKKLQNITLLSGGEKTLTALALLFASFLIKPSPLCVLDEADAALDETNTVKFAEMLRDLSRDIQFIVVTHNRVTMESADYLYGITMEEPGISKSISLEMAGVEAGA